MIRKAETDPKARNLGHYLGDLAREIRVEMLGLLDAASVRRGAARRLEAPIRAWEASTRVVPPRGEGLRLRLEELVGALDSADHAYRRIYRTESRALLLQKDLIDQLDEDSGGSHADARRMLECAANLRDRSLTALERAMALSSRIRAIATRCTAMDVVAVLDDRRRAVADSDACRARADQADLRAFRLETAFREDLESAVVKALGADDELAWGRPE